MYNLYVYFFDVVPSLSKIIEQRRRRIKKHIEFKIKTDISTTYLSNLTLNNIKLYEVLFNKHIFTHIKLINSITFNYSIWIKNKFYMEFDSK